MNIHHIKLKNLHSLKGEHEISFSTGALARTGLFAIVGPTGSGKSTLLDAITLALYNCTPRSGGSLSSDSIDRTGAFITRNTNDAFCEVEYDSKGRVFRSRWEVSRARTGKLRDSHMSIAVKNEGGDFEFLDLKKKDVPVKNAAIIGLNYDQFVKSIMLSQGEFAKFLKSKPAERSALLEKITGTEIYTQIGVAAFEKQKQEKILLEKFQDKLGDIAILSDEEIESIHGEIKMHLQKVLDGKAKRILVDGKINTKKQLRMKSLELEENKKNFALLESEQDKLKPDDLRLKLHNKLLPQKSDIDRLVTLSSQLTELENEINQALLKKESLGLDSTRIKENQKLKVLHLDDLQEQLKQLLPLIVEVEKWDGEISIGKLKKEQVQKRLNGILIEIDEAGRELKSQNAEWEQTRVKLGNIENFMNQNPELEGLGDILPGIVEHQKIFDSKEEILTEKIKKNFPKIAKLTRSCKGFAEIRKVLDAECAVKLKEKKALELSLGVALGNQQEILDEIEALNARHRNVSELWRLSEFYHQQKNVQESNKQKIKKLNESLELTEKGTLQTQHAVEISEKTVEELEARRDKEMLQAKYDDARNLLKPDVPCPLCGSKNHPLVQNYHNALSGTRESLKAQKQELGKLKNDLEKIKLEKGRAVMEIDSLENVQKQISRTLDESLQKASQLVGDNEKTFVEVQPACYENQVGQLNNDLKNASHKLKTLTKISALQEALKGMTLLLENSSELITLSQKIDEMISPYSKYLQEESRPAQSLEILTKKLSHFREAIRQKGTYREKEATFASIVSEKKKRLIGLNQEKETVSVELAETKRGIEKCLSARKELFGEKDPKFENEKLTKLIKAEEKQIAELEKQIEINAVMLKNLDFQLKELKHNQVKTSHESQNLDTRLMPLLQGMGMSSLGQAQRAMLNQDEAEQITLKLEGLKASLNKVRQTGEDIQTLILSLGAADDPEATLEDLELRIKTLDADISALDQQTGTLKARLAHDEGNRQRSTNLRQEIQNQEKEYVRWEALNKLIGDAKGARFSKYAQQLTLLQLLAKANHHLKKLTDRYLIIIENSAENDELFVIDTYHGDEKRSVKTLSGGESFLVSLALALGLSDLAGSKTEISSLFIDEGFGSLDQETLDVALSTLERLQHETNRTIGIISHVEALKERISTQIELTKDSMGNSTLNIKS